MTSAYLLQSSPMFVPKSSPKSSASSPAMDGLTPAHSNHSLAGHRQSLADQTRYHQGHSGPNRNSGISSQLRCNPHFPLSLSPSSSSSSSSLRNETRPGMHSSQFLPHSYLQHRNIFGVMGSPWVPSAPELNKHLPQLQMPLENMELWQGGSLITPGTASWVGFESRGRNVAFPYPYAPMNYDVRRKNATRESTTTLKAWLYKHIKNPYPTKGEKVMLAIITKMSLTQVSTWFANARRRLKKENKMQWSPRQRTEDDEDKSSNFSDADKYDVTRVDDVTTDNEDEIEVDAADDNLVLPPGHQEPLACIGSQQSVKKEDPFHFPVTQPETPSSSSSSPPPAFIPQTSKPLSHDKPKIWSLASMVDCDEKKSTNEKKTRVLQSDASTNERQANAWVTPTWMFHAAICRQMLNLQLQQQQQQQQQQQHHHRRHLQHHHHHHHQQQEDERMLDQSSSSEMTTQRDEFHGTPVSRDVTGEEFQQPITSDD